MRILVTGAAGFMASHLVDFLIGQGHQVFGVDDLSGGYRSNINPKSRFYQIDLRHKLKTINLISKTRPKIIYHLAADASEGRSQFMPISCTKRNYSASLTVLVGAIRAKTKRLVFTSSMSVYGDQQPPFNEKMAKKPVDIYGISKAATEEAIKVFAKVYGLEYVILRAHNVYGPRQNLADPYRNVIAIFINRLLQEKHFYIYGDGKQKRSFSYIDDVTPCIAKAGFLKNLNREIINIGPKKAYTINELSNAVLSHFVDDLKNIPQRLQPVYLAERPLEVKDAYCTNEKAQTLLGFKQRTSLKEGIARTVAWAKTIGPQKFKYLKELELVTDAVPQTWKKKLI